MKRRSIFRRHLYFMLMSLSLIGVGYGVAKAQCEAGITPPTIQITSPAISEGEIFQTSSPTIHVEGEAGDDVGLTSISWTSESGGLVLGSGKASTWTDWDGLWLWEVDGIPIRDIPDQITVITLMATDTACHETTATLWVKYAVPLSPQLSPQTGKKLDTKQAKFTFYFGSGKRASDPAYNGIDRFSTVAYMQKGASETFVMPFNMDVTVSVEAPDPRNPGNKLRLFGQTLRAGRVSGKSKYRYTNGGSGINEIVFETATSTSVYFYIFVDKVRLISDGIKSSMSPDQYQKFIKNIKGYTLTLQLGPTAWTGSAPLVPGTYGGHKQELVHNR